MGSRTHIAVMFLAVWLTGMEWSATVAAEPVIRVIAHRYRFEPDRISLRKGEPVTLELHSPEVLMSFNAPDFLVSEELPPGKVVHVHLVPDKTGDFVFVCDIYCGSGHEKMRGVISVGAP